MKATGFRLLATILLLPACALLIRAAPADELDRAFERLHQTSYRKREVWLGAAAASTGPAITEYSGGRSRTVIETGVPGYGTVRQERIAVNGRAAVRTVAPGITGRLNEASRSATAHSAHALLGQVAGLGVAAVTGGMSGMNVLQTISTGVGAVSSAAQASAAIGHAKSAFGSWQLATEDESSEAFAEPEARGSTKVEKMLLPDGRRIRYRRVAADESDSAITTVIVDAATRVPVSEETVVNGQPLCRVEYFDVGVPIAIELPDVLR